MRKGKVWIFGVMLVLACLQACVQEPNFPMTPNISFRSIQKITKTTSDGFGGNTKIDSLILGVNFQDGDGDLGLTDADAKANPKYRDFKNFVVDVLIQKNGKFVPVVLNPALGGRMNFNFKPNQKPGPIEGTVFYSAQFVYAFRGYSPLFTNKNDTLKFKIQIIDNAFNASNVVESDPIVIFNE